MKFTIKRSILLNQIANVQRAIQNKATIPILTGMKLELNQTQLILVGSDAEISIESIVNVNDDFNELTIIETGSIVLPSRLFSEIVKKLPTESVTIQVNESSIATITSGKAVFNLVGINGTAYPKLPEFDMNETLELPSTVFKQLINQTIFSASNQENRPILTGLHLINHKSYLSAIATDSHRLSKREMPLVTEKTINFEAITIPKKTMLELMRIANDEQTITMIVSQQQVIFLLDGVTIYSRLLEGVYPDAERLIPSTHQTEIIVNASSFLTAIDRASLMSRDGSNNVVQMDISENEVQLTVRGNEQGKVNEVIETKKIAGQALKISFNPDYMKDALKSFEGADISIQMQSSARPLLLQLETPSELANNRLLQLLTPIRTH